MEALVNFQTMVCDLTGMPIANASMLDEATAAAEAMTLAKRSVKSKSNTFIVAGDCHPQTIEVVQTRAKPLGIEVVLANSAAEMGRTRWPGDYFAVLAQYPSTSGRIDDLRADVEKAHAKQAAFIVAADLLALTLLVPPGELGADIVVRHHPALRHADGRRRPARGLPGLPRRVQALAARPAGGRQRRRARQPGLPPGAADARAAHPPREGHVQHLHGAGAAGRGRQHVRGLPRAAGPQAHRAARRQLHGHPGQGPGAAGATRRGRRGAFDTLTLHTGEDTERDRQRRARSQHANLRGRLRRVPLHLAGRDHHARRHRAAVVAVRQARPGRCPTFAELREGHRAADPGRSCAAPATS